MRADEYMMTEEISAQVMQAAPAKETAHRGSRLSDIEQQERELGGNNDHESDEDSI